METELSILKHKYTVKESKDTLELLVNSKLDEWQIYNIDTSDDNYMSEEKMKTCIEYIIHRVMIEMTPTVEQILSVAHPMNTEQEKIKSIQDVAKLAVLRYSIQQNIPRDDNNIETIKKVVDF